MYRLTSLLCGVIFGLGLTVSGMINPAKVLNFLDFVGQWDPSLALVFVGALTVALPAYQWAIHGRAAPILASRFRLPESKAITPSLVGGAALFGTGWGLAGFCPGPGLASLATLLPSGFVFVVSMLAGAALYKFGISK